MYMQKSKVIWLLCTWLYLGKTKDVYNMNNKIFLCSYIIYLTDCTMWCTADPLLYFSSDIYIQYSSKNWFLAFHLLLKKKCKTENQIKRGHKSHSTDAEKWKVLFCVDLSMYHIHFKVMKSIKNSFMIENKKREYGLIKQRNTEFCRTYLETNGGSYPFSNVYDTKYFVILDYLLFSTVGVNMGPLLEIGIQQISWNICLFNLFEYVPYESNVVIRDGPGFMNQENEPSEILA